MLNFLVGLLLFFSGASNLSSGYHPLEWLKTHLPASLMRIRSVREKLEGVKARALEERIERKNQTQAKMAEHIIQANTKLQEFSKSRNFDWRPTNLILQNNSQDNELYIISRKVRSEEESVDDLLKDFILNPDHQIYSYNPNDHDSLEVSDFFGELIIPNNLKQLIVSIAKLICFYESSPDLESKKLMQTLKDLQAFIYCLIPTNNDNIFEKIYTSRDFLDYVEFMQNGLINERVFVFIQAKLAESLNQGPLTDVDCTGYTSQFPENIKRMMSAVVRPAPDPKLWQEKRFKDINYYLILMENVFNNYDLSNLDTKKSSEFNGELVTLDKFLKNTIPGIVGSDLLLQIQHDFKDLFDKMESEQLPLFENFDKIFTTISKPATPDSEILGSSVVENLWRKPNALSFEINGIISERKLEMKTQSPEDTQYQEQQRFFERVEPELKRLLKYSHKREDRVSNGNRRASRVLPLTRLNVRNIKMSDEDKTVHTTGLADLSTYECTDLGFEMAFLIYLKNEIIKNKIFSSFPSAKNMLLDYIRYRQVYCLFKTKTNFHPKEAQAALEAIIKHYDLDSELVLDAAKIALNDQPLTEEALNPEAPRQVEPPATKKREFKIVSAFEVVKKQRQENVSSEEQREEQRIIREQEEENLRKDQAAKKNQAETERLLKLGVSQHIERQAMGTSHQTLASEIKLEEHNDFRDIFKRAKEGRDLILQQKEEAFIQTPDQRSKRPVVRPAFRQAVRPAVRPEELLDDPDYDDLDDSDDEETAPARRQARRPATQPQSASEAESSEPRTARRRPSRRPEPTLRRQVPEPTPRRQAPERIPRPAGAGERQEAVVIRWAPAPRRQAPEPESSGSEETVERQEAIRWAPAPRRQAPEPESSGSEETVEPRRASRLAPEPAPTPRRRAPAPLPATGPGLVIDRSESESEPAPELDLSVKLDLSNVSSDSHEYVKSVFKKLYPKYKQILASGDSVREDGYIFVKDLTSKKIAVTEAPIYVTSRPR